MILALDQGTTSSRAIVFDAAGTPLRTGQREFPQRFPQPGWVEHDPEAIWASQIAAAREVVGEDCVAIGIANQRETTLLWDRITGRPVAPGIVWQDRRTAARCQELRDAGRAEAIREKTGLEIDPYFSATKLAWLLNEIPDARRRAQAGELAFGTVDAYLIWRLTGGKVHATDPTNASRTLLWNLEAQAWDDELLDLFGIPSAVLPEVRPSSGAFGTALAEHLGRELPILGVAGDQQAALHGQRCDDPGLAKCTYGTGCFLLVATGTRRPRSSHRLLGTAACGPGRFALEGSVFSAGAAVQWLRDGLGIISHASECDGLAGSVPDTGGTAFVPAFTGLGAPYWDAEARGAFVGITRGTTRAHLVRAVLEGIAHQVEDVLQAAAQDLGEPIRELRVDGGLAASDFLMQFQADLSGERVVRPQTTETTALGAARLARQALGGDFSPDREGTRTFEPRIDEEVRAAQRKRWASAVDRARGWA